MVCPGFTVVPFVVCLSSVDNPTNVVGAEYLGSVVIFSVVGVEYLGSVVGGLCVLTPSTLDVEIPFEVFGIVV